MRSIRILLAAALVSSVVQASSSSRNSPDDALRLPRDGGPVYVHWDDSCLVLELELRERVVFGREIGCGAPHVVGGGRTENGLVLGFEFRGEARVYVVRTDGSIRILQNRGNLLLPFSEGTWHLGSAPGEEDPRGGASPNH